jgi:hypothetical protein
MRKGVAVAVLSASFVATTALPAAAQSWGYAGWDEPAASGVSVGFSSPGYYSGYAADWGYPAGDYAARSGYAYSAPGGCACSTPSGYGYAGYGYRGAYAYQPGYAYSSSYAYTPGFAYGGSYGYRSYGYDSGPRYGSSESRFAARGEFRETTRARAEVRTGTTAREQGMVRTGNRDQAVGRGSVRESGMRTGANVRSDTGVSDATTGASARSAPMRGSDTARSGASSQGGSEVRSTTGRGGAIGSQNANQPGMR